MSTETIWNEFSGRLERFILSKVNDAELARDLLQEVFIKIHLKRDALKEDAKLSSWIFQITRNAIFDHYRKKKIKTDQYLDEINKQSEDEIDLDEKEIHVCITPFIDELPEKYKDALVATSFKNISQKDFAEKENLSYSAAKTRVQRARKMVKEKILECCQVKADVYGNILSKEPCEHECGCNE